MQWRVQASKGQGLRETATLTVEALIEKVYPDCGKDILVAKKVLLVVSAQRP